MTERSGWPRGEKGLKNSDLAPSPGDDFSDGDNVVGGGVGGGDDGDCGASDGNGGSGGPLRVSVLHKRRQPGKWSKEVTIDCIFLSTAKRQFSRQP